MSEVSISFEEPRCICGAPSKEPGAVPPPSDGAPDCAEDCGCGSACDCGCCILLARASYKGGKWTVEHAGVRRLIRVAMVADREPGEQPPAAQPRESAPVPPPQPEKAIERPALEPTVAPAAVRVDEAAAPAGEDKPPPVAAS